MGVIFGEESFSQLLSDYMWHHDSHKLAILLSRLGVFLLIIAAFVLLAVVLYRKFIKKQTMTGIMEVTVTLNQWPGRENAEYATLGVGKYLVGMRDSKQDLEELDKPETREFLFHPSTNRQQVFPVALFLHRFREAFVRSCGETDPCSCLLNTLLTSDEVYSRLGVIQRSVSGNGLRYNGKAQCKRDPATLNKLELFLEMPEKAAQRFREQSGIEDLEVRNICIMLQYQEPEFLN